MLEALPGEGENRRKDLIVARSPLLRVFIDKYSDSDPDMWIKMTEKIFIEKRDEMISLLGYEEIDKDLNTYLKVAKEYHVFPKEVELKTQYALIACFAWMGFEIGDEENVHLFLEDVLAQTFTFDAVNQTQETADFVYEVMKCGVLWKKELGNDTPDEFRDFISGLDFP